MYHVGFTGTQHGCTEAQLNALTDLLITFDREHNVEIPADRGIELHHGDCIGADAQADNMADQLGWVIVVHPPSDPKKRAWRGRDYKGKRTWREPLPYLQRNHRIVDECSILVACPRERHEELRSGTWATVRYARKVGKPVVLIYPDGSVER